MMGDYGIGHEEKRIQEVGHEKLCIQVYINKASKLYIIRLILQVKIKGFLSPKITQNRYPIRFQPKSIIFPYLCQWHAKSKSPPD